MPRVLASAALLCVLLPSAAVAQAPDVYVVNRSSVAIRSIQLAVPGTGQWGTNLLGDAVLPAGYRFRVPPQGGCAYDVRVVYASAVEEQRRAENICAPRELAFHGPSPALGSAPATGPREPAERSRPLGGLVGQRGFGGDPDRERIAREEMERQRSAREQERQAVEREMERAKREAEARSGATRAEARRQSEAVATRGHSPSRSQVLPEFPWPPPEPSSRAELARALFVGADTPEPSLAAVARRLTTALEAATYSEYSFYRAPGGFALVARLERMADDGTPLPAQFRFLQPGSPEPFSLATYVKQLFFAPAGFYRQLVFVASDQPFTATGPAIDAKGATRLLREGANRLPDDFERMPFSARHHMSALVYEFQKGPREGEVATLAPGRLPARTHLERAGILPVLGRDGR
jgi:hypothetical protein